MFCASCSIRETRNTIKTTDDLDVIREVLEESNTETLVIWDVDEVLIVPTSGLSAKCADTTIKSLSITPEQRKWISNNLRFKQPIRLVDNRVVNVIKDLHRRNIKTLALTKCKVGTYGDTKSRENLRIEQLTNLGIEFKPSFSDKDFIEFNTIHKKGDYYPIFKAGILFCDSYEKGEVLGTFLDAIKWNPQTIIFIDDGEKHLMSVQEEARRRGIQFIGIHYKAVDEMCDDVKDNIFTIQYKVLVRDKIQLTDQQAECILNKQIEGRKTY